MRIEQNHARYRGHTVAAAVQAYLDDSHFDASSYTEAWASLPVGPLTLKIPNVKARKVVLRQHDIHHVLTGYEPTVVGEAEVSAYEVASGLGGCAPVIRYLVHLALPLGMMRAPRRVFWAFVRGRYAQNVLERDPAELYPKELVALREELGLANQPKPGLAVGLAFAGLSLKAALAGLIGLLTVPALTTFALLQTAWRRLGGQPA